MKTVTTYFFVLMVIPATVAAGGELLTNPGFESGLTGWSVSASNGWTDASTTAHSGAESAVFTVYDTTTPYSAYVLATQSIAYDGSSEYTLSVYARDNWSTGSGTMANAVTLKIEYYNASSALLRTDQQSYSLSKDYQWYQYVLTVTGIPAGTAIIKPVIGTTQVDQWGKSILFDDASLIGVTSPQPHTGDLNNDLQVNFADFALLAGVWRQTADWDDLLAITSNWLVNYSSPLTIVPSKQTAGKYDYVFFDINSVAPYSNPYNPDDIRVDITFENPDSDQIILPCFYVSGNSAASRWQGRFTPRKAGQYSYQASVFVNGTLEGLSDVFYLTVEDSNKDGFIHLNPQSDYSFLRDSGKPFRGIGENVAWDPRSGNNQTYNYEYMFPLLGANGCNFARVWMCPWNMPLEWVSPGLGRYNEASATRLDTVLTLAEQNGLYLMLTLDYAGIFETKPDLWGSNNYWPENPYNAANGGPCSNPAAFFSNSTAKEIYKKRLRYIIARWGYNPHLCVIELFNEIDLAYDDGDANLPAADIVSWHSEMSTYLKSIDPFGHLVSTSAGYKTIPSLWNVSNLDFSQTHPYGDTNDIYSRIVYFKTTYNKPYVAGEFGYGWQGPGVDGTQSNYERELHMGLWRGMFSPTPILPLTWWWDPFAGWNDWNIFNTAAIYFSPMISDNNGVLQELTVNVGTGIESMALKDSSRVFVWLRNNTSSTISSRTMTISPLQIGTYEVRYYDTWLGTYSTPTLISVTTGVLQSTIPSLTADKDIACRIVKVSP
ncbi:MAG: DUF5060 domain-containing protein [Sedimentisphaerales bacterium]|jgi:hypothetical protein